jgi:hypothetical protein
MYILTSHTHAEMVVRLCVTVSSAKSWPVELNCYDMFKMILVYVKYQIKYNIKNVKTFKKRIKIWKSVIPRKH